MKKQDKQPAWHLAKQALSHPERAEMLAHITRTGTGASEAELAGTAGLSIAKARYHLTVLRNAGLVEEIDEASRQYVAALNL